MNDRDFLIWLHERLTKVHGEWPLVDYMHRLRAIIESTPRDNRSQSIRGWNNIEALQKELEEQDARDAETLREPPTIDMGTQVIC